LKERFPYKKLEGMISLCIKRLETLNCFQKFKKKIKKIKTYTSTVDDLTKTFAMVQPSGLSNWQVGPF
jgi:hypothetical protein